MHYMYSTRCIVKGYIIQNDGDDGDSDSIILGHCVMIVRGTWYSKTARVCFDNNTQTFVRILASVSPASWIEQLGCPDGMILRIRWAYQCLHLSPLSGHSTQASTTYMTWMTCCMSVYLLVKLCPWRHMHSYRSWHMSILTMFVSHCPSIILWSQYVYCISNYIRMYI